jgi:hypothetical protein
MGAERDEQPQKHESTQRDTPWPSHGQRKNGGQRGAVREQQIGCQAA